MGQWGNEARPLTAGTRLGPYEIVAPLGAGGPPTLAAAFGRQLRRDPVRLRREAAPARPRRSSPPFDEGEQRRAVAQARIWL